jgi:membrane dipeptidase
MTNTRFFWLPLFLSMLGIPLAAHEPIVVTDRARELHSSALVIDGHNDLPWELRTQDSPDFKKLDISQRQPSLQTDIPRLREGGVKGQFWSVWVPTSTMRRGAALLTTLEQIDLVHRMCDRYPSDLALALTADELEARATEGKIASLVGVEGGHSIEESIPVLRQLYARGARYMTLTHSDTLSWVDSATDEERNGGLTPFGLEVIREMNRLGMMVDLSHVSAATMHQALDATRAPVIFSHSSCRAIAGHARNIPDDILLRLPENGGVAMINFFSAFVVPAAAQVYEEKTALRKKLEADLGLDQQEAIDRQLRRWSLAHPMPRGDIRDVLDHIEHAARVAGVDHVGLGSDFDGVSVLPRQLEDVSCYPTITQGLLDRGYTDADIRKILGGNVLRVFREVELVAAELGQPPAESTQDET